MRSWVFQWTIMRPRSSHLCLSLLGVGSFQCAAHWASWADCMRMVRQRHPDIAEFMTTKFGRWLWSMFRVSPRVSTVAH